MIKSKIKNVKGSLLFRLIISYILLIAVPVILISVYSYSRFSNQIKSTYHSQSGELLESVENNINQYFNLYDRITNNAQVSENIKSALDISDKSQMAQEKQQKIFDRFRADVVGYRSDIEDIYLFSMDNYIYYINGTFPIKNDFDITKQGWYKNVLNAQGRQLIDVDVSPVTNLFPKQGYVIYISRLIKDEYDKPNGVIMIELNFKFLQELIDKTHNSSKKMIIIDRNQKIIYDSKWGNITKGLATTYPKLKDLKKVSADGITEDESQFVTLHDMKMGWTLVLLADSKELSVKIFDLTFPIIVLGLSCLLIFIIISIVISQNISKPIRYLKKSMKRAEKGDLKVDTNVKFNGEIGELAQSYNLMSEKLDNLITEVYKVKIQKLDSEFKALQAQINPHFLYNVLEAVNCLAKLEGSEKISVMVRGLARTFRYCIRQGDDTVKLKDEINHVKDYVMLVSHIYDEGLRMVYDIPDELMEYDSLRFILQPIVENAMVHGLEKNKRNGKITISVWRQEEILYIRISDNGIGIDEESLEKMKSLLKSKDSIKFYQGREKKSIGLFNIHNRIRLYYGEEYGLSLESSSGYFTEVTIKIAAIVKP